MPEPTIKNGEEHFFSIIYEGNGGGQRVGKFVPFTDSGTIANSCIFNKGDSPRLNRTPSGTGRSRRIYTLSLWAKPSVSSSASNERYMMDAGPYGNSDALTFKSNRTLQFWLNGTVNARLITNRTFEDSSKFYHILVSVDTTQSTASDRVKIYVDGEQITSFSTENYPSQNYDCNWGNAVSTNIGSSNSPNRYYNGYLTEVNYVDGQALLPASFGQTDTSTGRWIPSVVTPYPTTTTSIAVTVVSSGGNKYALDGVTQGTVDLVEGATYRFDQSDSSNSGHPLRFSTTSNGTHGGGSEYTVGVTTAGTPGSSGAYTEITVASGAPTLYYYCTQHSGMGGTANTPAPYGTNGFRLQFGTASALGDDTSGLTNDFTATNLSSADQTTDSPTQNHATFDPNRNGGDWTLSEGNLKIVGTPSTGAGRICLSGMKVPNSNKIYWEVEADAINDAPRYVGIFRDSVSLTAGSSTEDMRYISVRAGGTHDGKVWDGTSTSSQLTTFSAGDIIQFARDGQKLWIGKNNTWLNSGNPSSGTNPLLTNIDTKSNWKMGVYSVSTGTAGASHTFIANTGQRTFSYTPPTGFSAWNQDNLPETDRGVSGLVWNKNRDSTYNHGWWDSSRGRFLFISSNTTTVEQTALNGTTKFLKGGYTVGAGGGGNNLGDSIVAWNWVANGGTTTTNNNGSITSTTQANTTAGFSIVQYTGTGSNATVGHSLSSAPEWILFKNLDNASEGWSTYHTSLTSAAYIVTLNNSNAQASSATDFNSTAPTSSVFSVGTNARTNNSSQRIVAYCWHGVDGFSKFGKYTGNGSTDGTFVYTGFKPAWVLIKNISGTYHWNLFDSARDTFNPVDRALAPSSTAVETNFSTSEIFDFLSNGFKLRCTLGGENLSGNTYIYMAFAEHPFVGDGTSPVTAR